MLLSLLSLIEYILFEKILVTNIETLELEKNILQQKHILAQTWKQQ
jgi:hypothetical protein